MVVLGPLVHLTWNHPFNNFKLGLWNFIRSVSIVGAQFKNIVSLNAMTFNVAEDRFQNLPCVLGFYLRSYCEMFGLIVSGQLVKTDFQAVGEKQFLINIPNADSINHIVVFLTGTIPFPDACGGLVYFSFPDPNSPPCWHLLGFISNSKPSAIFKVSNLKNTKKYALNADGTTLMFGQGEISLNAQIGIAVESLANIQQQCPATLQENISVPAFVEFSQKMLQNFLNYASSFVVTQSQMVPNPVETFIPSSVLTSWYSNFERRLLQNPYFWRD